MPQTYVDWIPTLYPLSSIVLESIEKTPPASLVESYRLSNLTVRVGQRGPYLQGDLQIAGLDCSLVLETSGLFVIVAKLDSNLGSRGVALFGIQSRNCYEKIGDMFHVHLFSHRLKFFPINRPYPSQLTYQEAIEILSDKYMNEIVRLQIEFGSWRESFLRVARESAEDLLRWPLALVPFFTGRLWWIAGRVPLPAVSTDKSLGYVGLLLKLLERRILLSYVSEALYNCRGAESFYRSFSELHNCNNADRVRNSQHREAFSTLISLYQEYGNVIGSYLLQATATLIAVCAIVVSMTIFGLGPLPSVLWPSSFTPSTSQRIVALLVLVAVVYLVVYMAVVRRIAKRFLLATEAMLEPGASTWRGLDRDAARMYRDGGSG